MTWMEFVKELKSIAGVRVTGESDNLGNYVVVHIGKIRADYFLISRIEKPDAYMAWHYISLVRMLAASI